MERDFMGLKKDLAVVVKDESVEGCKGSDLSRVAGIPWPLSSKVSAALHNFMPFKAAYEEKTPKHVPETVPSSGFIPGSAPDAFEANQNRISTEIQNVQSFHFSRDAQRPISVSPGNPLFGPQFVGTTFKQQPLGTTHSRFGPKSSAVPPQLTIFYAGAVHVFDEISPEKAQAIMLLATGKVIPQPRPQVQMGPGSNQNGQLPPTSTPPSSALSSPLSVSSHPANNPSSNDDVTVSLAKNAESPKIVASVGPPNAMIPSVPQARKASLARFLEKRKERVMNAAPYNISKKGDVGSPMPI